MICVTFFTGADDALTGFRCSGHSGAGSAGNDIVCAAVSSAVYLTANTITEVLGVNASVQVKDGLMVLNIPSESIPACDAVLRGLRLHVTELREQYPKNIEITNTEV